MRTPHYIIDLLEQYFVLHQAVALFTTDCGQSASTQNTLPPTQVSESDNVEVLLENENNDSNNSRPSLPVNDVSLSMSASATQCCFDPVILVSVATQTDDVPTTNTPNLGINVSSAVDSQEIYPIAAEQWKMS